MLVPSFACINSKRKCLKTSTIKMKSGHQSALGSTKGIKPNNCARLGKCFSYAQVDIIVACGGWAKQAGSKSVSSFRKVDIFAGNPKHGYKKYWKGDGGLSKNNQQLRFFSQVFLVFTHMIIIHLFGPKEMEKR